MRRTVLGVVPAAYDFSRCAASSNRRIQTYPSGSALSMKDAVTVVPIDAWNGMRAASMKRTHSSRRPGRAW